MFKDSSARYYQDSKERLQKKSHERNQSLSKEEKEKSQNKGVSNIKSFLKMENKGWLSIE